MRGEYREYPYIRNRKPGSPPHARGILFSFAFQAINAGITPACAGNTYSEVVGFENRWDHPRMRGEY